MINKEIGGGRHIFGYLSCQQVILTQPSGIGTRNIKSLQRRKLWDTRDVLLYQK